MQHRWENYATFTAEEADRFLNHVGDPFSLLGMHPLPDRNCVAIRVYNPTAYFVRGRNVSTGEELEFVSMGDTGLFEHVTEGTLECFDYELTVFTSAEQHYTIRDPYRFLPVLGDMDLYLIGQGTHYQLSRALGANPRRHQGVDGVLFAVWAPSARGVSVVGNFNSWDGRRNPMRPRGSSGVWELFVPDIGPGELYKFEVFAADGRVLSKLDPLARFSELRPRLGNVVWPHDDHVWNDAKWMESRAKGEMYDRPMTIYEVHAGSWKAVAGKEFPTWEDLAATLIPYVKEMGFTHIEFMPLAEHPLDQSWGYQVSGYYSATARYGTPAQLKAFVDAAHAAGIGVILDWVPAHFPKDATGLGRFDGTALYEHRDPRQGEHPHWGTYIFNYGRNEVKNFLVANALFWLDEYHVDGLRVDAVASMLYLDYGRNAGEWIPSEQGDNINRQSIEFIKHMTSVVRGRHDGAMVIAEESTAFPNITKAPEEHGLGFHYKWNMGWMNDMLTYIGKEPIHRKYHQNMLTFSMLYAFSEQFILVLSHDEVVHGKGSMINKMPGDAWQKFANLRLFYSFMWGHPGKKLLFMGNEFAQYAEWNSNAELDWNLLDYAPHRQLREMVKTLNGIYAREGALWKCDTSFDGFEWLDCDDAESSVVGFVRRDREGNQIAVLCNFTPVVREGYRFGVPAAGRWMEIFNSDSEYFGGSNVGNNGGVDSEPRPWHNRDNSIAVTLPPLGAVYLKLRRL